LYLRIPGWCEAATVSINGKKIEVVPAAGKYVRLEREWNAGDVVALNLPMKLSVQTWKANHDSASVDYGPLTFSLKIGERLDRFDSAKTAIGDSQWQPSADPSKWPAFEIHPTTAWNFGLVLNTNEAVKSFTLKKRSWPKDDYPFTLASVPLELTATAKAIPQWTLDQYGLCATLQASPVRSDEPEQPVSLVPMGAARLRVSSFPVIGEGESAHNWHSPITR
jgi:hypothetical protein